MSVRGGGGGGISAGTAVANGVVSFANSNGVTFGVSGGTLTATVNPGPSAGIGGIIAGTQTLTSQSLSFVNSNGISFGLSNSTNLTASFAQTGQGAVAAGTQTQTSGTLSFANSNGISFGLSNSSVLTASYTVPSQTNQSVGLYAVGNTTAQSSSSTFDARSISFDGANGVSVGFSAGSVVISGATGGGGGGGAALSAGTQSVSTGTVVFSNSNGVSFGMSGSSQITASVAAQSVQTQNLCDVSLSGNTSGALALVSSGTMILAGGNNITLSQNGQSITISGANAGGAQTGISAIGVSNTTFTSGSVTFSNSNGISFGSGGAGIITASYTVPTQTNQSIGVYGLSQTTGQSSSSTVDARSLSFNAAGAVSVGMSAGSVLISAPGTVALTQFSGGISTQGNTAGNTGLATAQMLLVGTNNITLSGSTNGGSMTISISGGAGGGGGAAISAGTQSVSTGTVIFSNSNGVSFGMSNSSVITASVSIQTEAVYASSNTTGQSSSSTYNPVSQTIVGMGGVSAGWSAGSFLVSGPAVSTVSGVNGISVSVNGSTISVSNIGLNLSAGTTSQNLTNVVFSNSNGVSFGLNGSTVTASAVGGGGGIAAAAGTQTATSGTVVFSNSNNVSFGMSNSSVVTATATFAQSNQSIGVYHLNNTTGASSSSTIDARSVSFTFGGALSGGMTAGTIELSVPATSSLVGASGLTVSTAGSTISISQIPLSRLIWPPAPSLTALSAPGNASLSVQYVPIGDVIAMSRVDLLVAMSFGSSATTNTGAIAMSMYGAFFTKNGSTLSSVASGSTQTTYTYASNTAGQTQLTQSAVRGLSIPLAATLTQGEYYFAGNLVTATSSIGLSTTNMGLTMSVYGGNGLQTAINYADITAVTATSSGLMNIGVLSVATTGMPASIALSNLNQTGAAVSQGNIAFVMRNV